MTLNRGCRRGCLAVIEHLERRALLTLSRQLVEIPISDAAKAADPALNSFRSFDLRITISAGDSWASGDLNIKLSQGQLYSPPDFPSMISQKSLWNAFPNVGFDTFVSTPTYLGTQILGKSTFGTQSGSSPVETSTTFDAAWGGPPSARYSAGAYTVARITVSNDAAGMIIGRVGGIEAPNSPEYYSSSVPVGTAQGTIFGFLFFDRDGNGTRTDADTSLGGSIYVDANNNAQLDPGERVAQTFVNGQYFLGGLESGTYTLRAAPVQYYTSAAPDFGVQVITLGPAEYRRDVNFAQAATSGSIRAIAYDDLNENASFDPGEPQIPGVHFTLRAQSQSPGPNNPQATSDANGVAEFSNLQMGVKYVLVESTPSGYLQLLGYSSSYGISTTLDQSPKTVAFRNRPTSARSAVIRGTVFNDLNFNDRQDPNETGIAGMTIFIDRDNSHTYSPYETSVEASQAGEFQFTDLQAGTYHIGWFRTSTPGEWHPTRDVIAADEHTSTLDIGVRPVLVAQISVGLDSEATNSQLTEEIGLTALGAPVVSG
jgi:hypothetical protein